MAALLTIKLIIFPSRFRGRPWATRSLNNFKSHTHKVLEPKTESYNLDSERYMAKACAYAVSVVSLAASVNSVNSGS